LLKHSSLKLILAGTRVPPEEVLKPFNSDARERIKVISSFTSEEERVFYQDAQIFIMPSFFEGQSVALTQAMAMGLCPIASDNCGQKDFVRDQENGLLFKTGNASDMEEKIEWLLQHKDQITILGNKARESVKSLTWANTAKEVVEVCESLL
jgi:glycosyltransferase involved in cell wall biosynthesis